MALPVQSAAPIDFPLTRFLEEELAPYPGRAVTVARMVTACVITMILVLTLKLPNGFLAVFFVLAISREDPHSTVHDGFAIVLGNIAGLLVSVAGIVLFVDYPLLHFLYIAATLFLAFFAVRIMVNYSAAFGFSIILVASASVNIIWASPNPLRPDIGVTLWTAFGMILGTLVTVLVDWMFDFRAPPPEEAGKRHEPGGLFLPDAFSHPAHLKYALRGCLAGVICYVVWSALKWPGLGVCTVTCVIAAPRSTPGSSRQRLITRLAGLLIGGVICGIGSQVLILPSIDSIAGFTLPFAAVSAAAAWVVTASPRLSYFGRQMALAYYLTIFQGFGVSASLATSRDRLMGILLGLLAVWMVFDLTRRETLTGG